MNNLHTFGRMELACRYSPQSSPRHAWRRLQDWMTSHPTLMRDLATTGYNPRHRTFTPAQVRLIYQALGEP